MNSMFLERISSFHKDNTEGQLTVHHHLTNNKTFLDYQRRTIAWMVNREETFSYLSEKCWIGFTGGVLADVLEDDRTFAMLYLVIANKGPEILYCKKVLLDDRCPEQRSAAPIPPTATSITYKITRSWGDAFMSQTSDSSRRMVERLSKLLKITPVMTENPIASRRKGETNNSRLVVCQLCKQTQVTQHYDCVDFPKNASLYIDTHFLCPRCWTINDRVPCKATLIVVPDLCLEFWNQAIQTIFSGGLNHFVYNGVSSYRNYIQPISFNKFDVVLTSYGTLEKDIRYGKLDVDQASMSLGYHANDPHLQSPLLCLNWWRICLDQPQSFNSNTEKVYEMASCLKSVHKWVMPGASIQESSKNIFNIMKYFNITKYNDYKEFHQYMEEQMDTSYRSFSKWIWCNLIKNINAELCLPKPIYKIHTLNFSKIEMYFYKRTAKLCVSKARSFYTNNRSKSWLSNNMKDADQETKVDAVGPINELFEACTVPLVSSENILMVNGTFSLRSMIDTKIKNCDDKCNNLLRKYFLNLNKVADITLSYNIKEARRYYCIILDLMKQHENRKFGTDYEMMLVVCKCIHINKLVDVTNGIYTDLNLESEFKKLNSSILKVHTDNVLQINEILKSKLAITMDIKGNSSLRCDTNWWIDMLMCISSPADFIAEVKKIINDNLEPGVPNIGNSIKSLRDISSMLFKWQNNLMKSRANVFKIYKILKENSNDFVNLHFICIRTLTDTDEYECLIVKFRDTLNEYKKFIINNSIEPEDQNTISNLKEKNPDKAKSRYEIILRSLTQYKTFNSVTHNIKRIAVEQVDILKIFSSEFFIMYELWLNLNQFNENYNKIYKMKSTPLVHYKHQDINFKLDGNTERSNAKRCKTNNFPLNSLYLETSSALEQNLNRFISSLKTLSSLQDIKTSPPTNEMCYACGGIQLIEHALLYCGHILCSDCLIRACDSSNSIELTCPSCNISNPIKYMERLSHNQGSDESLNGSYCTKVESIVFKLLEVTAVDNNIKIIIISAFEKSLDCLSVALILNEINFMRLDLETKNISTILNTFQNSKNMTTILINSNIELTNKLNFAKMVFFMEPLIDKSVEEKIVDLVCYKKKERTYVHRFILKNSIEEVISNMFYDDDNPIINVTLDQLATILL